MKQQGLRTRIQQTNTDHAMYGVDKRLEVYDNDDVSEPYAQAVMRLIARNVRERRKELGLSQEAAAHTMEVATRHLQKLEAGQLNVTISTLCRVSKALDMDIKDLLSDVHSLEPNEQ